MHSASSIAERSFVAEEGEDVCSARHSATSPTTGTTTSTAKTPRNRNRVWPNAIDPNSQSFKAVRKQLEPTTPMNPATPKKSKRTVADLPPLAPLPPATPRTAEWEDSIIWSMALSSPLEGNSATITSSGGTIATANHTSQPAQLVLQTLSNIRTTSEPSGGTQVSDKHSDARARSTTEFGKENNGDGDAALQDRGPGPVTPTPKRSYNLSKSTRKRTRSTTNEEDVDQKRVRFDDGGEYGAQPRSGAITGLDDATTSRDVVDAQVERTTAESDTLSMSTNKGVTARKDKGKARATDIDNGNPLPIASAEIVTSSKDKGKARAIDDDIDQATVQALPELTWENQPCGSISQSSVHPSREDPVGTHLVHPTSVPYGAQPIRQGPRPLSFQHSDATFMELQRANHRPKSKKANPYETLVDFSSHVPVLPSFLHMLPPHNGLPALSTTPIATSALFAAPTVPTQIAQVAAPTAQAQAGAATSGPSANSDREADVPKGLARCAHGTLAGDSYYKAPRICSAIFKADESGVESHLVSHGHIVHGATRYQRCPWVGCDSVRPEARDLAHHVYKVHVQRGARKKVCQMDACSKMFNAVGWQSKCDACMHT